MPRCATHVDWALEHTGLSDRAAEPVDNYSGGMRRRLNIACGIVHRPRVVLLDEPTVGVDPQSRDRIYDMLAALTGEGVSLLLTTHHLEEAEARCSRTVIIDHGRVIAEGTLPELVEQTVGKDRLVTLRLSDGRVETRAYAGRRRGPAATARQRPRLGHTRGRRRGARPQPAGRLHSSDRKGFARMITTLMTTGWLNLKRDRVAQALTFALPILFFSIFATCLRAGRDPARRESTWRWWTKTIPS